MEYSAVTDPRPVLFRKSGTPSMTVAVHINFVSPISTNAEPSACFINFVSILGFLISSVFLFPLRIIIFPRKSYLQSSIYHGIKHLQLFPDIYNLQEALPLHRLRGILSPPISPAFWCQRVYRMAPVSILSLYQAFFLPQRILFQQGFCLLLQWMSFPPPQQL